MKKILGLSLLTLAASAVFAAPLTPGNLLVVQVGEDGRATAPSSTGTQVYIKEYTTAGVLVQSFPLETTTAPRLVNSGTATSALQISGYLGNYAIAGYDAALGTTGIATSASASVNRVVAVLKNDGTISYTALSDAYDGNNIRSAVSDGTNIWMAGTAGTGLQATAGFRHALVGGTTSIAVNDPTTTVNNTRVINIFNGQLYGGSGSGLLNGVAAIGTGLPTVTGQSVTALPNLVDPVNTPTPSPYDFAFADDGNTIYVTDDRIQASGGGLLKYTFDGTQWNFQYRLQSGLPATNAAGTSFAGTRSVDVVESGSDNIIYVVSANQNSGTALVNTSGVYVVTDTGALSAFTQVANSALNTNFRGVEVVREAARVVSGVVTFDNGYIGTDLVNVTFEVTDGSTTQTEVIAIDPATGTYSFPVDSAITASSVDVFAKAPTHLRLLKAGYSVGSPANFALINGDVDADNSVTIFDYIELSGSFDLNVGDSGFVDGADLDKDGSVTIFDYIILSDNFDKSGD